MRSGLSTRLITAFVLLALYSITSPHFANAQKRLALLIGNKSYPADVGPLTNPHNDITLVGSALNQIGFSVVVRQDLERKEILTEVDAFSKRLRDAGDGTIGFFYYSGHGASNPDDHTNYLIPLGIAELRNQSAWYDAVRLEDVLLKLNKNAPKATHFVVFDACRNELQLPVKGESKGFEASPGKNGMFIAYAAGPNSVASDRGDGGGPYARALADQLLIPGQDHNLLFQNIASRVHNTTGKAQWPRADNGLLASIYLNEKRVGVPGPPAPKETKTAGDLAIRSNTAPEAPRPALSQWDHNNSTMRLESEGSSRRFYYVKPRPGIAAEGVKSGTLLFTGRASGNQYQGIAYIFDRRCGSVPYQVSGNMSDDLRSVVMKGRAPNQFDTGCRVVAYRDDRLAFSLLQ